LIYVSYPTEFGLGAAGVDISNWNRAGVIFNHSAFELNRMRSQ